MALLLVDFVALSPEDPWVLDSIDRWHRRGLPLVYIYDSNKAQPPWAKLPGGTQTPTAVSVVNEHYLVVAFEWLLNEINRYGRRLRLPHVHVRFGKVCRCHPGNPCSQAVECQILTVERREDGKGIGEVEAAMYGLVPRYPPERAISLSDGRPSWRADQVELLEGAHERDREYHARVHPEPIPIPASIRAAIPKR